MYNWVKFLTIVIVGIIVVGVTGCSSNRSNMPNNTNVSLNKLNITYPSDLDKERKCK
ncbi:hypothetical protein [Clostridium kluyveri]|uniref:hypothetical protein n=1 Tax=Clostridium kluyveri TaxID=1534 RepID=UPI002245C50A|nr:hypothetical protein [Clostridium kluyveri]UZQ51235.1 hypothetical protein OP486_03395 [Clostridium kluyveri]